MFRIVASSTSGAAELDETTHLFAMRAVLTRTVCREASECNEKFFNRRLGVSLWLLRQWLDQFWPIELHPFHCYSTLGKIAIPEVCHELAEEIICGGAVCDAVEMIHSSDTDREYQSDSISINDALKLYWARYATPSSEARSPTAINLTDSIQLASPAKPAKQLKRRIIMTKVSKKIAPSINQANAWKLFERKLELLLANLNENSYLIISIKQSNQLIQFVAQGSYGTRVETISNHFLFEEEQLDSKQIASLIKIGWHSPTGTPEEATPEDDPDGSPNFFVDYPANTDFSEHAGLAVQTFAKILRVQHPRFLQIKAFDANGTKLNLKKLGLQVAPPVEQEAELKEGETLVLYTSCQ